MKLEPSPRAVFLVGFMGAGKSRIGRELARSLGWRFTDLDRRVEAREGRSIAQIFRKSGEAAFRRAETAELKKVLRGLNRRPGVVVALGGGVPAQPANRRLLRRVTTVFVDVPLATLWKRCRGGRGRRPLLTDAKSFRRLYASRLRYYRAATFRIRVGKRGPAQTAAVIGRKLSLHKNSNQERP